MSMDSKSIFAVKCYEFPICENLWCYKNNAVQKNSLEKPMVNLNEHRSNPVTIRSDKIFNFYIVSYLWIRMLPQRHATPGNCFWRKVNPVQCAITSYPQDHYERGYNETCDQDDHVICDVEECRHAFDQDSDSDPQLGK